MKETIDKYSTQIVVTFIVAAVFGWVDIRIQLSAISENSKTQERLITHLTKLAEITRQEQLLRSDEIEWVQTHRVAIERALTSQKQIIYDHADMKKRIQK